MKEDLVQRVKRLDERRKKLKTMIVYLEEPGICSLVVRMFFRKLMPKRLADKIYERSENGVTYDDLFANEDMRECFLEFIEMKLEETEKEISEL